MVYQRLNVHTQSVISINFLFNLCKAEKPTPHNKKPETHHKTNYPHLSVHFPRFPPRKASPTRHFAFLSALRFPFRPWSLPQRIKCRSRNRTPRINTFCVTAVYWSQKAAPETRKILSDADYEQITDKFWMRPREKENRPPLCGMGEMTDTRFEIKLEWKVESGGSAWGRLDYLRCIFYTRIQANGMFEVQTNYSRTITYENFAVI